ncbi:MAG: histone-lysine N-methyltransferase [Eggerthellaceae bacterium]|nr:histone-lysine N-methyltransferase [Eggerthellaceae bacterium]
MPKHARTDKTNLSRDEKIPTAEIDVDWGDENETHPREIHPDDVDIDDVDSDGASSEDASEEDEAFAPSSNLAASDEEKRLSPLQRRSRKTKRTLLVVIGLLIVLIGALSYFAYQLFLEAQTQAQQQAQQKTPTDVNELKAGGDDPQDATTATTKKTEVPLLTELIGLKETEALARIGRGAIVVSSSPFAEEGNPITTEVKISLTEEPGDTRSGNPTVYLGLDGAGVIIRVGYSAAVTTLGYGSSSFSDAVTKDFLVEHTLSEGGLAVAEGSLTLPQDKAEYTTYKDDGKTVLKEIYSFSGSETVNGVKHEWSAVLRYDYTAENASGNLADTIRQVYVYIFVPSAATPPELLPKPDEEKPEAGTTPASP